MTTGLVKIDETYYYGHTPVVDGCVEDRYEAYLFRKSENNVFHLVMSGYCNSIEEASIRFREYIDRVTYPNC